MGVIQKEVYWKMSLKKCTETRIIERSTIFDYSDDGELRLTCSRIEGHDGTHLFIHNGKRIEQP